MFVSFMHVRRTIYKSINRPAITVRSRVGVVNSACTRQSWTRAPLHTNFKALPTSNGLSQRKRKRGKEEKKREREQS